MIRPAPAGTGRATARRFVTADAAGHARRYLRSGGLQGAGTVLINYNAITSDRRHRTLTYRANRSARPCRHCCKRCRIPAGRVADDNGLCYYSGCSRNDADRLAAFSTSLYPLWRLYRELPEDAAPLEPSAWALINGRSETRLTVFPVFVGEQLLHMTLAGSATLDSPAYVKLAALLLRRYVGVC